MNNYIGVVTSVDDDFFTIHFKVDGLIDDGVAIPLHTMQQPEVDEEVVITGGDDILNTIFVYQLIQNSLPVIFKAYGNYIQLIKDTGSQLVSPSGDILVDAGKTAVTNSKSGIGLHGGSGPVDLSNDKKNLSDLIDSISKFMLGLQTSTAGGMPIILSGQCISAQNTLNADSASLLGVVTNSPMSDEGGSSSSAESAKAPTDAKTKNHMITNKSILNEIKDILNQISTQLMSGVVSPMGPCSCPGAASIKPLISKLGVDINNIEKVV